MDDLLSIFKHLKNFAEITVGTLVNCPNIVQFRPHVYIEPVDHSALLTEITGISNLEQAE
jgi:hypothetical protein